MDLKDVSKSLNPIRKTGEIMGRLESQEKTSADADRIVSGEDEIKHILSIYTLDASIELGEERLPESYIEGYKAGMEEASESIRHFDLTGKNDYDFPYVGGD